MLCSKTFGTFRESASKVECCLFLLRITVHVYQRSLSMHKQSDLVCWRITANSVISLWVKLWVKAFGVFPNFVKNYQDSAFWNCKVWYQWKISIILLFTVFILCKCYVDTVIQARLHYYSQLRSHTVRKQSLLLQSEGKRIFARKIRGGLLR